MPDGGAKMLLEAATVVGGGGVAVALARWKALLLATLPQRVQRRATRSFGINRSSLSGAAHARLGTRGGISCGDSYKRAASPPQTLFVLAMDLCATAMLHCLWSFIGLQMDGSGTTWSVTSPLGRPQRVKSSTTLWSTSGDSFTTFWKVQI